MLILNKLVDNFLQISDEPEKLWKKLNCFEISI